MVKEQELNVINNNDLSGYKNKKVDYIKISDAALSRIKDTVNSYNGEYCGVRISVLTKGCSGLSYMVDLIAAEDIEEKDEWLDNDQVNIFIAPKAILFIIGLEMDYQYEYSEKTGVVIKEGFVFVNPNEKGRCGCGESFFV